MINCPANQTIYTTPNLSTATAMWTDHSEANDNSGITAAMTCRWQSGSQFQIGLTVVVCEARDASGNQANCTFVIEVIGKCEN